MDLDNYIVEEYIKFDGVKKRLYYNGHIHTHPLIDTTKISSDGIKGKDLLSVLDNTVAQKFENLYIVYNGSVFQYFKNSYETNSLCRIVYKF